MRDGLRWVATLALITFLATAAHAQVSTVPGRTAVLFDSDPLASSEVVLDGAVLDRVRWNDDAPAFPGDVPGSLTAVYDSRLDSGRIGWPLPGRWTHEDDFTAVAVLVIDSDGFRADPFGFFQLSWGLWSTANTGLERTGTPSDFAANTFEMIEFAWFPNVSPFFGGPFLSPAVFGAAHTEDPLFGLLGAFVNIGFGSSQAALPLDTPLLAVLEHRVDADVMQASVFRWNAAGRLEPLPGATTAVPLAALPLREYAVDTVGLTLWRDGFGGDPPSLFAEVTFHAVVALPASVATPEVLLDVARSKR